MSTRTLAELALELGGTVLGDNSLTIRGVAGIREARAYREQAVQRGGRTGFACHVPRRPQVPCEDARPAERAFGGPPRRSGRCQGSRAPRQ